MGANIKIDQNELQEKLKNIIGRIGHAKPAMEIIAETVMTSIQQNFEAGGRPDNWPDLAASTKAARARRNKWPGKILVMLGAGGGLMGSISYEAMNDKVVFSANKEYAAIHQFGGQAGRRNKRVTIPARPYMMVQDEDWQEISEAMDSFIMEGK